MTIYTRSLAIGSNRNSGKGIHYKMTIVMDHFVWNTDLDTSLFSLEPPEGYDVEQEQVDASEADEKSLVNALAFWTEMSGGNFPLAINELGDPNKLKPMLVEKFGKDGDVKAAFDEAFKKMGEILKGLYFAQELKADNNWNYSAEGVHLGDADLPVCWWKQESSEKYRVIYGDLSIGDSNEVP